MTRVTQKDLIYQAELEEIKRFEFNEQVAVCFDDMISRSVPRYGEVQEATARLAVRLLKSGSTVLDLGCSTGTSLFEIAKRVPDDVRLIGVDNSEAMLKVASAKAEELMLSERVSFVLGDITEIDLPKSDLVILNYTLQFVPVMARGAFLTEIYEELNPGGALILSEKLRHDGERVGRLLTTLYYDFKRDNHYSELEISQKREALENVLVPLTLSENLELLSSAGFTERELYLKWINFATIIALR
jgi:tRNA (cmo5U34)-methyltransferase